MNGLPYYKAYPRDFIEGTIGMSFELKGAYRLVLDLIYMQGGNLPDDARYISGQLGCSIRKWKSLRDDLVAAGKIQVSGEFLRNKRAEKELETLAKLQETKRENRAAANKNKDLGKRPSDHTEPEPDKKEDTNVSSQKRARSAPEGFDEFWQAYPHRGGVKRGRAVAEKKYRAAVRSGIKPDYLVSAAHRYGLDRQVRDGYAKDPATWLNQRGWDDEIDTGDNIEVMRRSRSDSDFGAFGKIPERC